MSMFIVIKLKKLIAAALVLLILGAAIPLARYVSATREEEDPQQKSNYIKWVDFDIPSSALGAALDYDVKSMEDGKRLDWVELLAYLGCVYGGDFSRYRAADLSGAVKRLQEGETISNLVKDYKNYEYYYEAYHAVLGGMVGSYETENQDQQMEQKYGLKAFSPIAKGYGFGHYEDFGSSRDYGYKRKHLGHDLMGTVGTPIIAVESGIVEAIGWNQYGGWRIGLRSLDGLRYYYYAHLRKDHPYVEGLSEGQTVTAGDVIGYLGMTGYSAKENVNNINQPHLHIGLQLIFDPSQKDGSNQIWIDLYDLTNFLERNRSAVEKTGDGKDYRRVSRFNDPAAFE